MVLRVYAALFCSSGLPAVYAPFLSGETGLSHVHGNRRELYPVVIAKKADVWSRVMDLIGDRITCRLFRLPACVVTFFSLQSSS